MEADRERRTYNRELLVRLREHLRESNQIHPEHPRLALLHSLELSERQLSMSRLPRQRLSRLKKGHHYSRSKMMSLESNDALLKCRFFGSIIPVTFLY